MSLILLAGGIEYMLRQVPNPLAYKRCLLEKNTLNLKTLIIGSSVVNCSINPVFLSDSTYNLAISGEWFRFNQALLEKHIDKMPSLKFVIWGICFHSLWTDDCEEVDESSLINHKIYMDITREDDYFHNVELPYLGSLYNPQNEMFRLLGTKRSFSQNETFFFSHHYPPTLPFST